MDLAAVLGFHGMLNQTQYYAGLDNVKLEGGGFQGKRSVVVVVVVVCCSVLCQKDYIGYEPILAPKNYIQIFGK